MVWRVNLAEHVRRVADAGRSCLARAKRDISGWVRGNRELSLAIGLLFFAGIVTIVCAAVALSPDTWAERRSAAQTLRNLAWLFGGIIAGGVGLYGIYLAGIRTRAADRQARVAEESHLTELFTKAIEQLGSEQLEVRLGAIYALERIARDSARDHWPIMETLTAFVRENAPWPPSKDWQLPEQVPEGQEPKPRADIQAILTVLGRRNRAHEQGRDLWLDLRSTDLRGANLSEAHLERAELRRAHLEGAYLWRAHLERAFLTGAHLEGAILSGAHLEGADLMSAHLEGASLAGAHLEHADLRRARITRGALSEEQLASVRNADTIIWVDPPARER